METWILFANILGKNYQLFVAILANLMYVFTGISLAWSSPVLVKLNGSDNNPLGNPITPEENDLLGSVFSIGGAFGPALLTYILEVFGVKLAMTILAVIFPTFYFVLVFSKNIYLYYVARIVIGMAVGGSFSTTVVYIGEIVSTEMRGTYMSLGISFMLLGCLFSYSVGPFISIVNFNLIIATMSLFYLPLVVLVCPESVYSTMRKKGADKTLELLKKLRSDNMDRSELERIEETIKEEKSSLLEMLKSKPGRKAFSISSTLLIFQQLCGVAVVTTFTQLIFEKADVSIAPEICVIIFSAFQAGTCFITPLASKVIDRKALLNVSFIGAGFSHIAICLYFYLKCFNDFHWIPLLSLMSFALFVNCGLGSLPWVFLGELYPSNMKSVGTALSSFVYWLSQFVVTYLFNKFDIGTSFLFFGVICLLGVCFVNLFVIETRGKSLQEIQKILGR